MSTADDLAGFALLDGLSDAQRAAVAGTAQAVEFPAGTRIFDEGQPAQSCWLIRTGTVALDTAVPGRRSLVIQTLGAGDLLGWSWLVPPCRWQFGAVSSSPVEAVQFDTDRLRAMAEADTDFGYRLALALFEAVLQRLQSTRARLLDVYGDSIAHTRDSNAER